jgi:hypothetical protein
VSVVLFQLRMTPVPETLDRSPAGATGTVFGTGELFLNIFEIFPEAPAPVSKRSRSPSLS